MKAQRRIKACSTCSAEQGPPHLRGPHKCQRIFFNILELLLLFVKSNSKNEQKTQNKLLETAHFNTHKKRLLHLCGPLLKFLLSGRFISKSAENEMIQFADLAKSFAHEQTNETSFTG